MVTIAPASLLPMKLLLRCFSLLLFAGTVLAAAPTAVVTASSPTYKANGASVTVTVTLNYDGVLSALDFSAATPDESGTWKVPRVVGPNVPQTIPEPDDIGAAGLGFVYTDVPAQTATFSF